MSAAADEILPSRRAGGDAGHVSGCARDHALNTACAPHVRLCPRWPSSRRHTSTSPSMASARWDHCSEDGCEDHPIPDAHEIALAKVEAARAALHENLRAGYALNEGQIATVLRVADALAAGVSLEARETLGREVRDVSAWFTDAEALDLFESMTNSIGERLFALGRASVVPPDADLARVIAAWSHMSPSQREHVRRRAIARAWSTTLGRVRQALWEAGDVLSRTTIACGFADDGLRLISVTIDGDPATDKQWAKLRAAGVPVAEGVGV